MLGTEPRRIQPFRPSYTSVLLWTETGGKDMRQATGFVIKRDGKAYLVSNGHVFSGRHPWTRETDHCPDAVRFKYWCPGQNPILADYRAVLHANGNPKWLEHPVHGARVDVAALPLDDFDAIPIETYDPWRPMHFELGVGDDVTIVGFPFGVNTSSLAIWTRASIASEYDADYEDLPMYLVDARTRSGQSGSPVIFFRTGAYFEKYGAIVLPENQFLPGPARAIPPEAPRPRSGFKEEFLGVYSGRVNSEADLGFVWRPSALREIIEGAQLARW